MIDKECLVNGVLLRIGGTDFDGNEALGSSNTISNEPLSYAIQGSRLNIPKRWRPFGRFRFCGARHVGVEKIDCCEWANWVLSELLQWEIRLRVMFMGSR